MMTFLVMFLTAIGAVHQPEANALRQTAPSYLPTDGIAAVHLAAATYAGEAFSVDPALLLSIAWHESRYKVDAVTREHNGRLSCGLTMVTMAPGEPCPEPSVLDSYLRGAEHVREWLRACRGDQKCALRGYAGGYKLLKACREQGSYFVREGVDACDVGALFTNRAAWIRTRMQRAARGGATS